MIIFGYCKNPYTRKYSVSLKIAPGHLKWHVVNFKKLHGIVSISGLTYLPCKINVLGLFKYSSSMNSVSSNIYLA